MTASAASNAGLAERLRGDLVEPGDTNYDDARAVYNAMHDRRPQMIVLATDVADVMAAVSFARASGLPLAVRGGGHSVAGFSTVDDGLVLDLRAMRGIRIDTETRTARVEPGCTWGGFNHATHAFGLATTGGVVSTTGVAGLTLGGGMGHLTRQYGLACDNLISADVVTADGDLLTCDADRHADLFWALRGGGGNFGVVTSFEFKLHAVDQVIGGPTLFEPAADVLRHYRGFIADAPPEMNAIFGIFPAPPLPFLDEAWHKQPVMAVVSCWTGDPDEGMRQADSFLAWGKVIGRHVGPMPYPVINTLFDELLPGGLRHYWKSIVVHDLPEAAIDVHLEHGRRAPTIESGAYFWPLNGAVHRLGPDDSAFSARDALLNVGLFGTWHDPSDDDANIAWVRAYHDAIQPFSDSGGYVNFVAPDDDIRVQQNYGASWDRLRSVKRRYDPANLFRLNQNIPPAR